MSARPIIEIECTYEPLVAGGPARAFGSERYPLRIDAFGTHELDWRVQQQVFEPKDSHRLRLSLARAEVRAADDLWRRPFRAAGAYSDADDFSESEHELSFSASTAIILYAYATTGTKIGQECWTNVGVAVLTLQALLGAREGDVLEFGFWQNRDNNFSEQSRDGAMKHALLKGRLFVHRVRALKKLRLRRATKYDVDASHEITTAAAHALCAMIDRGMTPFFGPGSERRALGRPTMPFLMPFHVPEYRTPRMPLPSSAYCMHMPVAPLNLAYFEQCLDIALARSGHTRPEALALSTADELHRRSAFASVCVRCVCVQALSLVYLDDFLNRSRASQFDERRIETDEDFKMARLAGADDCEGVALEILMHVRQLLEAPEECVRQMSELLAAVREFFSHYVPTLMLGCVTNRKMVAADLNQECALAHTFCALLPRWFFDAAIDRSESLFRDRKHPVLLAEGTAPIDPAMRPVNDYYGESDEEQEALRAALSATTTRRDLTDLIFATLGECKAEYASIEAFGPPNQAAQGEDYSNFYKYAVSIAAPSMAARRQLDWALVQRLPQQTFGVTANALLDADLGQIQFESFLTYTESEARLCDAVLQDQQPIPNLVRSNSGSSRGWQSYRTQLDRCVTAVAERDMSPNRGTELHRKMTFITCRERDLDERFCTALERIVRSPAVRRVRYAFYELHKPVDGTADSNSILDVYIEF